MPRSLTSNQQTAIAAGNVVMVLFVEMLFDAGALRVTSMGYDIDFNGHTWQGVGQLGSLQPVREAEGGEVSGLQFELSGVPSALLSLALSEATEAQGRACNVYVGFLDPATYTLIDNAAVDEWKGKLDVMTVGDDGEQSVIRVTAENELFDFQRPDVLLWTDEEQQRLYAGDLGLQYVAQQGVRPLVWPAASFFAR